MYVCGECGDVVGAGIQRKLNVIRRADGNIEKEIPVCVKCWKDPRAAETAEAEFRQMMEQKTAAPLQSLKDRTFKPELNFDKD